MCRLGCGSRARVTPDRMAQSALSLLETVAGSVAARAAEKGVELSIDLASDLPSHTHGDPPRFKQVILNLLSNAVKFSARDGEVSMNASAPRRDGVNELSVTVTVTVTGMTAAQLAAIFSPFVQAKSSTTRRHRPWYERLPDQTCSSSRQTHCGRACRWRSRSPTRRAAGNGGHRSALTGSPRFWRSWVSRVTSFRGAEWSTVEHHQTAFEARTHTQPLWPWPLRLATTTRSS